MKKIIIIISALLLLVLAVIPSVYFYNKYQTLQKQLSVAEIKDDIPALTALVGKLILLPEGETPTVMTVTDKEKLSGQLFFANAKNGDKVLVYEKAKKAFLYDPDENKVIEVGPILTSTPSGTLTPQATPPATQKVYTFAVLNATLTKGLAERYATTLVSKVPEAEVVARGNAKGDYTKSVLVDVTGTRKDEATTLAKTLGLDVSPFPAGESTPSAEFLIIVAEDQK
ncbi:hypothetical protein A2363_05230 [Candidatus Gottesmanbacteria bacterium RIFOXYB1_FULL_47_11]|uniref:LytR/CpsA/Psr regulator C-terminal domain-containing protein n=1 Tax=Candidatus Gottesmanbacteria bacterium RIFOXYB1_FULL_47_11 TaxID=1798401 RepID=A0A1F6BF31_9BACT|nr:MAG: hypothetical protein A2363_05230 [Candidatus Gottesmanbacteria bacterium RIFOXYB1_FULL_47_11]